MLPLFQSSPFLRDDGEWPTKLLLVSYCPQPPQDALGATIQEAFNTEANFPTRVSGCAPRGCHPRPLLHLPLSLPSFLTPKSPRSPADAPPLEVVWLEDWNTW